MPAQIHEYNDGIPRPKWMAHIVLGTHNKARLKNWYDTVFMTKDLIDSPFASFTSFDHEHHRFAIVEMDNATPPDGNPRLGLQHYAYSFGALALEDLLTTWERLRNEGIEPHVCVNHGTTTSLYYYDPDGNEVELMSENFETAEEANEWFAKGFFDRNYFGKGYDPAELLTKLRAGVPAKELQYPARTDDEWPEMGEIATVQMGQRFAAYEKIMVANGWVKPPADEDVPVAEASKAPVDDAASIDPSDIQSAADLATMFDSRLRNAGPSKLPHVIGFDFGDAGQMHVDGTGEVMRARPGAPSDPDTTVILALDDFKKLMADQISPQSLLIRRKLKIKGNMLLMMKLRGIIRPEVA